MRRPVRSSALILAVLTVIVLVQVFSARVEAAPVTYLYTGNPFDFCGYGCPGEGGPDAAPANWDEDYLIASLTFADPLPPNMPLTDLLSQVTAWTISDAFGFVSLSSAAGNVLTGVEGTGPLLLSTDAAGNIMNYEISTGPIPPESPGHIVGLFNPPFECDECGDVLILFADFFAPNFLTDSEWNAASSVPGEWTIAPTAIPEPASMTLMGLGMAAGAVARHRRRRVTSRRAA